MDAVRWKQCQFVARGGVGWGGPTVASYGEDRCHCGRVSAMRTLQGILDIDCRRRRFTQECG